MRSRQRPPRETTSSPAVALPSRRGALLGLGALATLGSIPSLLHAMSTDKAALKARYVGSPAWSGARFDNLEVTRVFTGEHGFPVMRYLAERGERQPLDPLQALPLHGASFEPVDPSTLRVLWIGHSTVLLEIGGLRVLTDPVWSQRASPVPFAGPERFLSLPIPLDELPTPDLVLLTHDHYDHLDARTVRHLGIRRSRFVAPLGVGRRLVDLGIPAELVTELDWWEEHRDVTGRLRVVATPTRHFSGRAGIDKNSTLWCGFVIESQQHRVFFGGDGGFSSTFDDIGRRYGPFHLSCLEIGAYDAAWADVHLGPLNAVRAQPMLRSALLLPIHWATFNMAMHPWYEPGELLVQAAREAGQALLLPYAGEIHTLGQPLPTPGWWRSAMG